MKKRILVTGGAGFIGSAFVRLFAETYHITVLDKLTYASDRKRLKDVASKITFLKADLAREKLFAQVLKNRRFDCLLHCAGETHVDRSLEDLDPFVQNNIMATANIINYALKKKIQRFIHISTDEIYGSQRAGRFKESAPLNPQNPYAATKAVAEFLVQNAMHSKKLPACIIRPANNYGPWQYPEKFIPLSINRLMNNKKIPVYGRGKQIREWLYVDDCVRAVELILRKGKIGETYNIGSDVELPNIETARHVLKLCSKSETSIQYVPDRPGHDFKYGVDAHKVRKLGWRPHLSFQQGLKQTIQWHQTQNI